MKVKKQVKNKTSFPIVGIGASAGGFEAFSKLLKALPADTGMAFVFVQHLAPDHDSALTELLGKNTKMPAHEVKDNTRLEPNNLYVIPPNTNMIITDGTLKLTPRDKNDKIYHPINSFFISLALACRSNAIGVILSGTATDGTLGLRAIKAEGGITAAQDETAKYQGMPRSAIDAGVVDLILSPGGIAKELARISKHPYSKVPPAVEEAPAGDELTKILYLLRERFGADFTYYKQTTIRRRVIRRVMLARFTQLEEYAAYLQENTDEAEALYQDLLIKVTSFFRELSTYQALARKLLPVLLKKRKPTDPIRIWIAGCATGEEAYSIAIVLLEYLGNKSLAVPIQIFATDLNAKVIEHARTGIYPESALANVSPERLKRFFSKIDGSYQVSRSVRAVCNFACHNFLKDPPFSRCDLISCQNVLIYFEPILQEKALAAFHYGLKAEGFLILGKSETLGGSRNLFAQTDKAHKFYTKKVTSSPKNLDFVVKNLPEAPRLDVVAQAEPKEQTSEIDIAKAADTLLLTRYVPASVIINSDLEILQFRGETSPYLQPSGGRASLNLLKMVKDELEFDLRTIIHQAKKKSRPMRKAGLPIKVNGTVRTIGLEVVPIKTQSAQTHFLIIFKDTAPAADDTARQSPGPGKGKRGAQSLPVSRQALRIAQLEQDQAQAREQMKSMLEGYETAKEELQSTNEEVLSSNEELQTINEELETSKEELESTNEELTTINDELQDRNTELKAARDYVEAIVETVRQPLIILNQDLRVRTANKAFYKVFKTLPEQTEGCFIFELGEDNQWDIPSLRQLLSEILPENNTFADFEVTQNFSSIGKKTMLLNARRLVQQDGKKSLILLAIEDITDRKSGEGKLKQSEEHFRFMAESMPQKIFTADDKGNVDYFNPVWMEFTGLTFGQIRDWGWLQFIHPDDKEKNRKAWQHSVDTGKPFELIHRFKRKDGAYRWHVSRARPMRDEKGNIIKWYGSNTDIDDQKSALEHRDEFIGIASHELKTPVTSVKAYTQILGKRFRKAHDMKSAELVGKMDGQLDKLTSLIADLLDVTKIETGRLEFHESSFDFNELVIEIVEEMQRTTDKHKIVQELESTKTLYGDRERLGQVITNFITNAIKYSPHSDKIILKTVVNNKNITLCVQDFGVGLSKTDQLRVFERFYRVGDSSPNTYPGLGLGLYIAAEIIKRQNGKIWVEGKKGKGSAFCFSLPIKKTKIKQPVRQTQGKPVRQSLSNAAGRQG